MRVLWSPAALREVLAIHDYLALFNPPAAVRVMTALIEAGDRLAAFPHRGRHVPGTGCRELTVAPPYVIRYEVVSDSVHILRVRHRARRTT